MTGSGSLMWTCEFVTIEQHLLSTCSCSNQSRTSVPDNTMTTTYYTVSCVPTDTVPTTTVPPTTTATELPTTTVRMQLTSTGPQQPESTSATVSTTKMKQTTTSSGIMESEATSVQSPGSERFELVLFVVLGFLLLLVLCVLIMILCVAACYCRRYRSKLTN